MKHYITFINLVVAKTRYSSISDLIYICAYTTYPILFFFVQLKMTLMPFCNSGMGPDSRVLVRKCRKQAQQYFRLYKVLVVTFSTYSERLISCILFMLTCIVYFLNSMVDVHI